MTYPNRVGVKMWSRGNMVLMRKVWRPLGVRHHGIQRTWKWYLRQSAGRNVLHAARRYLHATRWNGPCWLTSAHWDMSRGAYWEVMLSRANRDCVRGHCYWRCCLDLKIQFLNSMRLLRKYVYCAKILHQCQSVGKFGNVYLK